MSLKQFHVVFITLTLGLMGFQGYWAFTMKAAGQPQPFEAVTAAMGFVAGLAYLGWFLRKYRALA